MTLSFSRHLIPSTRRKRPSGLSVQPPPESPAQRTPVEIIELILEHYIPIILTEATLPPFRYEGSEEPRDRHRYTRGFETVAHVLRYYPTALQTRRALSNFSLVCRLWCSAGLQHLYKHPILLFNRHVVHYLKVLEKHPQWRLAQDLTLQYNSQIHKRPDHFLSILRNLPSLESLSIVQSYHLHLCPFGKHLDVVQNLVTRLRVLKLYGGHEWTPILKLSFPALEHLRLQYLTATDGDIFTGELPNLQTLQLVQVQFDFTWQNFQRIGGLPSLHTMEVYLTTYKRMDRFLLHSSPDPLLDKVKHLVLGIVEARGARWLRSWRLPPSLVSLTFLVNLTPYRRDEEVDDPSDDGIYQANPDGTFVQPLKKIIYLILPLRQYQNLENLNIITQLNFEDARGTMVERARRDYTDFFHEDQTADIKEFVADYLELVILAKHYFPTASVRTMWTGGFFFFSHMAHAHTYIYPTHTELIPDLASFVNYRLSLPFGTPINPHKVVHLDTQKLHWNESIEYEQEHVALTY